MAVSDVSLRRIDHLRFVVGNARQSAYFYRNAFGFQVIAYAGLETGVKHEASYVLKQGDIVFVLSSPLDDLHPDNVRLTAHGDGRCRRSPWKWTTSTMRMRRPLSRGAVGLTPPTSREDEHGVYWFSEIKAAYGDTKHRALLIARSTRASLPPVSSRSTPTVTIPARFEKLA